MTNFSFDDVGRKDFLIGILLWLVMEFVSFVVLPAVGVIEPGDRLKGWFLLSLPLGIGGALLLGGSSRFITATQERSAKSSKLLLNFLGQFGGGLGLFGIVFPFVMVTAEFFAKIFGR
jgi:hypothetical protein